MALQHAQLLKRDITLSVEGEDIFVTGYRHEFLQVLLNLINNAVDQLHKKWVQNPKITIRLKEDALILEDNAGGIDPKIIDRIFEPYFTTKAQGEGTGLGLYIAKVIIEKNLGGRLEARNNIRGALFEITFPKEAIIYLKQRAAPALES
jgi:signal transduction histidine kinase